jgi:Domain of unknown function (DUF4268)
VNSHTTAPAEGPAPVAQPIAPASLPEASNGGAPAPATHPELGTLEGVDARDIWKGEEYDFTPWLSQASNLELLSKTIGMDLEFVDREVRVGRFEADIVAQDLDNTVVIENQLERTDHDHLGKLLVYASGLDAKTVIWIAREITDEYRNALDWLNENTREGVNFFGLEIELWKIGNSPPAPKFNLVCQPNEWKKTLAGASSGGAGTALTETRQMQLEFWTEFGQYLADQKSFLNRRKPLPRHWYTFALGRTGFDLSLTIVSRENQLGCELYIKHEHSKLAFQLLREQKDEIETELGALDWRERPGKHVCRVIQYTDGSLEPQSGWPQLHAHLRERAERFHQVLGPRIQKLSLDQPQGDDSPGYGLSAAEAAESSSSTELDYQGGHQ